MPKSNSIIAIGAGNVASHFIPALHAIGFNIIQVYSRTLSNAQTLARKVKAKAIDDLEAIDHDAEWYLIMVKDDAIKSVLNQLPELNQKQFLAHTSGATPTTLLGKKAENFGSFYALQTFKKGHPANLKQTPFFVYGNNEKTQRLFRITARKISKKVTECSDIDRLKYHISAVFINNFVNHLACVANDYLIQNALDPSMLDPIRKKTFNNILNNDPCQIQTGPAVRNDEKLEKKHLALLKMHPELKKVYKALSSSIKAKYEDS